MSEFWLISAPGDRENLQALERMNTVTSKSHLSYNTKFAIPDFKVGTLDSLVGLSDELGKLDTFAESLIRRMAQSVVEVMEDSKGKAQEHLLANGGLKEKMKCLKIDLTTFVTHFEWDMAKYPAKQPLVSVVDTIAKQLAQIETDLKSRTAAYNTLKTNLENLEKKSMSLGQLSSCEKRKWYIVERKLETTDEGLTLIEALAVGCLASCQKGNLFTRTLSDIVNKEDFVLDSEYLVTLLVIVPKPNYSQWQKTYESLSDMVVPRSTKLITEDKEGGLFTVTLFRKVIEDFKSKARENKFTVREFYYDEKEIKREREEMARLLSDKKQQYGPLLRWLKVNFSEAFIAWIHIKALRVFVESVLRHLWRSRDCNSVIKTIFLMSTSISTLVFLTRKASWHLSHVRADCYSHLFPLARECLTCLIELRFFSEKLLTKVSDSCIYFFLSYNKMLSSPLNVLTNSKFHFSECFT
uniref:V-type proton ATPase subunit C n=1 Tax=Callithrix jacchus TaxID=9483 RepID=F7H8R0_CALJA|nr:V-type proton ATPase subunit C 2 isoform X6 [Callithrix jacchus]